MKEWKKNAFTHIFIQSQEINNNNMTYSSKVRKNGKWYIRREMVVNT